MLRVEMLSHTNVVMCSGSEVEVEGSGAQMRGKGFCLAFLVREVPRPQ